MLYRPKQSRKRDQNLNRIAKRIVRTATEESAEKFPSGLKSEKNPTTVALDRLGGHQWEAGRELKSHPLKGVMRSRVKPLKWDGRKMIYI